MPSPYYFKSDPLGFIDDGAHLCLFLDFDGTLVPIQNDPGLCVLSPAVKDTLVALTASGRCTVVVMSGRALPDISKKVDLDDIYYGGNHGLIISGPMVSFIHPDALVAKDAIHRARVELEREISTLEGAWIEDKGLTFTLHYRQVAKEMIGCVRSAFHRVLSTTPEKQRLRVLTGKKVIEITPNVEWDKGKATLFLLGAMERECVPFYIGDDTTDEYAFKALAKRGITVRVGRSKKTAARYHLKGQWEVLPILRQLGGKLQVFSEDRGAQHLPAGRPS